MRALRPSQSDDVLLRLQAISLRKMHARTCVHTLCMLKKNARTQKISARTHARTHAQTSRTHAPTPARTHPHARTLPTHARTPRPPRLRARGRAWQPPSQAHGCYKEKDPPPPCGGTILL